MQPLTDEVRVLVRGAALDLATDFGGPFPKAAELRMRGELEEERDRYAEMIMTGTGVLISAAQLAWSLYEHMKAKEEIKQKLREQIDREKLTELQFETLIEKLLLRLPK